MKTATVHCEKPLLYMPSYEVLTGFVHDKAGRQTFRISGHGEHPTAKRKSYA